MTPLHPGKKKKQRIPFFRQLFSLSGSFFWWSCFLLFYQHMVRVSWNGTRFLKKNEKCNLTGGQAHHTYSTISNCVIVLLCASWHSRCTCAMCSLFTEVNLKLIGPVWNADGKTCMVAFFCKSGHETDRHTVGRHTSKEMNDKWSRGVYKKKARIG